MVEVTVELLNGTIAEDINLNLQLYSDNLTAHAGIDIQVYMLRNMFNVPF